MTKSFLKNTYGLTSVAQTVDHYNQWASSYDAEIARNGYALPGRMAEALAALPTDKSAPLLDFGCGTGLSGLALKLQGFECLDGMDVSQEMIAQAEQKSIYRTLLQTDPTQSPPIRTGQYALIVACGVIGSGAAPVGVLDDLTTRLSSGQRLAFSFNDTTLADPVFNDRVTQYQAQGFALIYENYGAHLPGINLSSTIYIIEKE